VDDWLQHRWQAASDMGGTPVPGAHWLQLDLPRMSAQLSRVFIDYEVALSMDYYVSVWCVASQSWAVVFDTAVASDKRLMHRTHTTRSKQHIIHDIRLEKKGQAATITCGLFDKIRLDIRRPATRFGTSVWRFEAYGFVE
jgi:hypothetical protein